MTWLTLRAVWQALTFTAPEHSAPARVEAVRSSSLDGTAIARLYNSANASDSIVWAVGPGFSQTVYVSLTVTANAPYGSRRGGQAIQVRLAGKGEGVPADAARLVGRVGIGGQPDDAPAGKLDDEARTHGPGGASCIGVRKL